jgi:hypothetical protein
MKNKLLSLLGIISSLLCVVVFAFADVNNEQNDASVEMNIIEGITKRFKEISDIQKVSMMDRKQLLHESDNAFSLVQSKKKHLTKHEAKDILTCLNWISSSDFGDRKAQDRISQQMALYCLHKTDELDFDLEFGFVRELRLGPSKNLDAKGEITVGKDWQALRVQIIKYRLHVWQSINKNIDLTWDPKDTPVLNVAPPVGESGMSPDAIADPKLRAEYKDAIEANRKKAERYSQQSDARKFQRIYLPRLQHAIADAYSMPPVTEEDIDKLKENLQTYVSDKKVCNELLDIAQSAANKINKETKPSKSEQK